VLVGESCPLPKQVSSVYGKVVFTFTTRQPVFEYEISDIFYRQLT